MHQSGRGTRTAARRPVAGAGQRTDASGRRRQVTALPRAASATDGDGATGQHCAITVNPATPPGFEPQFMDAEILKHDEALARILSNGLEFQIPPRSVLFRPVPPWDAASRQSDGKEGPTGIAWWGALLGSSSRWVGRTIPHKRQHLPCPTESPTRWGGTPSSNAIHLPVGPVAARIGDGCRAGNCRQVAATVHPPQTGRRPSRKEGRHDRS